MADGFEEFDAAVNSLKQRLIELGVKPPQAEQAAIEAATAPAAPHRMPRPSRVQPGDETGVTAGEFGLPPRLRPVREPAMLSSPNTAMGDFVGAYNPLAGEITSKIERGAGAITRGAAELTGFPQAVRAGESVGNALANPTLPNATDAGVQSALALGRPFKAAGIMAGGLGIGAAEDAGLFGTSAQAQQPPKAPPNDFPNLPPEVNSEYARLRNQVGRNGYRSYDERDNMLRRMRQIEDLSNQMMLNKANTANQGEQTRVQEEERRKTEEARVKQAEYDRAVKAAEGSRDAELARNRRFSDTEFGKVWDKTSGTMPGLMAIPVGAVTRMSTGGGTFAKNWGIPLGAGAVEGVVAQNIPLAYNAFGTEPDNPEKRAYEAYSRDLPPGHPRKAEYAAYAAGLDAKNPVRKAAAEEAYDPVKAGERGFMGALEGMAGALFGNKVVGATARYGKGSVGALTGRGAEQRTGEAASLERNALAGSQGAPSGVPGVHLGTAPQGVELNALMTGRQAPTQTSAKPPSVPPPLPERQSLPPGSSANQSPSDILKSIKAAPREVPTNFPQTIEPNALLTGKVKNAPKEAAETLPNGMVRRDDGVLYWGKDTGKGGHPVGNEILTAMGLENRPKVRTPQDGKRSPEPPEKTSVQIDDMRPMGSRRDRYEE